MHYDSSEEKKFQQSMAEKIKHIRHVLHSENSIEKIKDAFVHLEEAHQIIAEKVKLGIADDEDMAALLYIKDISAKFNTQLQDVKLVLGHHLFGQSQAYFFKVKEAAAKGDKRAQEIYNDLLPLYRQALGEGLNDA